jgi:hypothetical protein
LEAEKRHEAAIASLHFELDPKSELPVMSIDDLAAKAWDRRHPYTLVSGNRIRLIAKLYSSNIYSHSLHFMSSPQTFLYQNYDIDAAAVDLTELNPGDEVEMLCEYFGSIDDSVPGKYVSRTDSLGAMEIHKIVY